MKREVSYNQEVLMERIPPSERISRQIKEAISSLNDKRSNQETLRDKE